jgi:hypothetical protein
MVRGMYTRPNVALSNVCVCVHVCVCVYVRPEAIILRRAALVLAQRWDVGLAVVPASSTVHGSADRNLTTANSLPSASALRALLWAGASGASSGQPRPQYVVQLYCGRASTPRPGGTQVPHSARHVAQLQSVRDPSYQEGSLLQGADRMVPQRGRGGLVWRPPTAEF